MMIELVQRLLSGDANVPRQMEEARRFWTAFFEEHGAKPAAEIGRELNLAQSRFNTIFGGNWPFAKEMMPVTCLGTIYGADDEMDEGRRELARKMIAVMGTDAVSVEVHGYVREAAALFGLDD
jgi:hypothetical protein